MFETHKPEACLTQVAYTDVKYSRFSERCWLHGFVYLQSPYNSLMARFKKYSKQILIALVIMSIFGVALYFANMLTESERVLSLVEQFGYVGVLITAIIAGLNTFVPLPAATFAPLFIEAGLSIPIIIIVLATGTLIADSVGFALGHVSREIIKAKYPKMFDFFTKLQQEHTHLILPVVILYASFIPFPNEAILIPLALAGAQFKHLILPLIIGNTVHQIILVFGVQTILDVFM